MDHRFRGNPGVAAVGCRPAQAQRSGSEPLVCGTPGRAGSDSHSQHTAARGFVEIQAAAAGTYRLRIRPYDDKEPSGRYAVKYVSRKERAQSAKSIQDAIDWLGRRSLGLEPSGALGPGFPHGKLRAALKGARVVGLGEATHGSREFGDLRLSLTKSLVEQSGFRIVAIEASKSRLAALVPFIDGEIGDGPEVGSGSRRAGSVAVPSAS